ncbi:MAG: HAD-IC family P-type ATPase [Actinobacteria bacterium]|nr:HAD-IC family P-type ATPase [Actinomycetota bacterium]
MFGALTLAFGDWRDAIFLFILLANSGIGIAQELRAKRALDRLAALVAPRASVVRDGNPREVAVEEVVPGDLLRLAAGDQVVADGRLTQSFGLALDESILSGEAQPVVRTVGDEVQSGSFAVEGAGSYTVTAVGSESYAGRITGEAREFRHPRSPLELTLNRLLLALVVVLAPLALVLGFALWERDASIREAVTTAVAGAVTLIPEGLILLAALTYAAASTRMARRGALAQQLNAVESLASVDVICLDKTGTLTEAGLRVTGLEPAAGVTREELARRLGGYAAASPTRNGTLEAIAEAFGAPPAELPSGHVPFSSRWRWSALSLGGESLVLGAPELFPLGGLAAAATRESRSGRRVVALGRSPAGLDADGTLPDGLVALGLVYLGEELRPDTRRTVQFLRDEGIELKVISGDAPETVAAIARDAGIAVERVADGSSGGEPDLAATVVGRISPEGKRRFVEGLRDEGRYVAMVGDGVNDVPALKAARLGIAQGTGSQMARSVADVVLVRGDFAAVPAMVAEGRNILRNVQRVTKLFVAKSAFAAFLILSIGLTETEYPLLPRHLTLAAGLTIGIPSFFLALAPSAGPWQAPRFLREVARFAIPAGTAAGLGVLSAYLFSLNVVDLPLVEARTVATTVLVAVGLYLVLALEAAGRRRGVAVSALCVALFALFAAVLAWHASRAFFELAVPGAWGVVAALGGTALAISGLALTDERFVPQLRVRV